MLHLMNNVKILNSFNGLLLGEYFKMALLSDIKCIYNINPINYDWLNAAFFCSQSIPIHICIAWSVLHSKR